MSTTRERPGCTRSGQVRTNFMAVYPGVPRKSGFNLGNLAPCHQILYKDKFLIELKDCTAMVTPEIFHTSVCNVAKLIAKGEEIWIKRCD
jgi:hypothetical protein